MRGAIPASAANKQELAQELRSDLWDGALEAHTVLGSRPAWTTRAEFEVRAHVHDVLLPQPGSLIALQCSKLLGPDPDRLLRCLEP